MNSEISHHAAYYGVLREAARPGSQQSLKRMSGLSRSPPLRFRLAGQHGEGDYVTREHASVSRHVLTKIVDVKRVASRISQIAAKLGDRGQTVLQGSGVE